MSPGWESTADWTTGEEIQSPFMRSLSNPAVDEYGSTAWTTAYNANDKYAMAGVPNKMFYLLVNGGQHKGVTVTGIGLDKAIRIALRANKNYWKTSSTLRGARDGMVESAYKLYPSQPGIALAVKSAWDAVRVTDAASPTQPGSWARIMNWLNNFIMGDEE
jgi:thermolysin